MTKYNFEVKTGDQSGAGTDSNIFIIMYGTKGISDEIRLNGHISGNAFERNDLDKFTIKLEKDLGDIYEIILRSDCKYAGSDWLCAYFEIARESSQFKSKFAINRWFSNESSKTAMVTSGFNADVPTPKINTKEVIGSKHFVPSQVETQIKCTNAVTVTIDSRTVEIIENTTSAKVEVSVSAVTATIENVLKYGVEKHMGVSLQHVESTEVTCTVPLSNKLRIFQEVWSEEYYDFSAVVGEQTYKFAVPKRRILSGLIEVTA